LPSPTTVDQAVTLLTAVVLEGETAGEIDSKVAQDIEREVDGALGELEKGEPDKALEKLDKAQERVEEALEKGEITSPERAEAIDSAIDGLAELIAAAGSGDDEGDGDD
jgi:hypothetical protein